MESQVFKKILIAYVSIVDDGSCSRDQVDQCPGSGAGDGRPDGCFDRGFDGVLLGQIR